jgi:uncharacterized protein YjbJ (UPF0337 family)
VKLGEGANIMWNKSEIRGKMDQAKGRAKQAAGDLTKDERLRSEGEADEVVGKVEDTAGRGARKVGEAIEDFGKGVKRG